MVAPKRTLRLQSLSFGMTCLTSETKANYKVWIVDSYQLVQIFDKQTTLEIATSFRKMMFNYQFFFSSFSSRNCLFYHTTNYHDVTVFYLMTNYAMMHIHGVYPTCFYAPYSTFRLRNVKVINQSTKSA